MWRFLWEYHQEIANWPDTADSPANRERGRIALREGLAAYGP